MNEQPPIKSLPVVPPAIEGESLGSWLGRIAALYHTPIHVLFAHAGIRYPRAKTGGWIHLGALGSMELRTLAILLRTKTGALTRMNSSLWDVASIESDVGFCERCLAEDHIAERPMHWRRAWLDSFNIVCAKHHSPLNVIVANRRPALPHAPDWSYLIDSSRNYDVNLALALGCMPLQFSAQGLWREAALNLRYGLSDAESIRQVAGDLLDAVLSIDQPFLDKLSALSRFALLCNLDNAVARQATIRVPRRTARLITFVKSFHVRCAALAAVDALMATSAQAAVPGLSSLYSARAWREEWLWLLMSIRVSGRLLRRSRSWPPHYVNQCWPELAHLDNYSLVRRRKIPRSPAQVNKKNHPSNSSFS